MTQLVNERANRIENNVLSQLTRSYSFPQPSFKTRMQLGTFYSRRRAKISAQIIAATIYWFVVGRRSRATLPSPYHHPTVLWLVKIIAYLSLRTFTSCHDRLNGTPMTTQRRGQCDRVASGD